MKPIEAQLFTLPHIRPNPDAGITAQDARKENYSTYRRWLQGLTPSERREYSYKKARAFNLIGAQNKHELVNLINDPNTQHIVDERVNRLLGGMFGIHNGNLNTSITRYAEQADGLITSLGSEFPKDLSGSLEMVNEIEIRKSPARLIGSIFDPRYSIKAKFEAWRKLELMHRALLVEQSRTRGQVDKQMDAFTDFMNQAGVWLPQTKIGEFNNVYFLSHHNLKKKFDCAGVDVLEIKPEEAEEIAKKLPRGQKLTQVSRRKFKVQSGARKGEIISVYISNDRKENDSEITKLVRKKELIPEKVVDDRIRTRIVTNNPEDLDLFLDHVRFCAEKFGSDFMIDDISDTLAGGQFDGSSAGSSPDLQVLKFFLTVAGARIEIEGFTNIAYINSEYKQGQSHQEYEVNRLFKPVGDSAIEWFFPPSLYMYNPSVARDRIISRIRRDIEEPVPYPIHLLKRVTSGLQGIKDIAFAIGKKAWNSRG